MGIKEIDATTVRQWIACVRCPHASAWRGCNRRVPTGRAEAGTPPSCWEATAVNGQRKVLERQPFLHPGEVAGD